MTAIVLTLVENNVTRRIEFETLRVDEVLDDAIREFIEVCDPSPVISTGTVTT